MPELPEVETVRRVLEERLKGLRIVSYEVGEPTFYRRPPRGVLEVLVGSTVTAFRRRGKYLLLDHSGGPVLILHLGMSGRIVLGGAGSHLRFRIRLEGGEALNFHDPRRFGRVGCELPELGPEPLEPGFDAASLFGSLRGRRAPIKAMLMDQGIVAGLGNIYATEALFKAGIRPGRAALSLSRADADRLCSAIKEVLAAAVEAGGSTLEDEAYLDPLGRPGNAQNQVSVYGRDVGSCGHVLKATRRPISGRTSLYCPTCQA